ncbi:META domain-containing protein [Piscinibacter defluvii]|uniref:META domain-containing protein n=1 Tax=Piscinibacter defluvii TaxID=1796922 RepID=UPI000FDECB00|nr:META domain-containing protein [Piscinibacter defluvii]
MDRRWAVVVVSLLQAACAAPPAPGRPVDGEWVIAQARSEPLVDKRFARLVFEAGGRLSGHTGCNTLNAAYTLEGDRLKIGPVATTRRLCPELQREQEDRVLTALELAATARVRPDGILELRDAEGRGVLRATRPEP